jgi:hypothetical protein
MAGTPFTLEEETRIRLNQALDALTYLPIEVLAYDEPMLAMLRGLSRTANDLHHEARTLENLKKRIEEVHADMSKMQMVKSQYEQVITTAFGSSQVETFLKKAERALDDFNKMNSKEKTEEAVEVGS